MGHLKKWAPAEVAQFTTGGWWVPPVRCIPSIGTTAGGPCVRCGGVGVPCQAGYSKIFEPSREAVACGCCEARKWQAPRQWAQGPGRDRARLGSGVRPSGLGLGGAYGPCGLSGHPKCPPMVPPLWVPGPRRWGVIGPSTLCPLSAYWQAWQYWLT